MNVTAFATAARRRDMVDQINPESPIVQQPRKISFMGLASFDFAMSDSNIAVPSIETTPKQELVANKWAPANPNLTKLGRNYSSLDTVVADHPVGPERKTSILNAVTQNLPLLGRKFSFEHMVGKDETKDVAQRKVSAPHMERPVFEPPAPRRGSFGSKGIQWKPALTRQNSDPSNHGVRLDENHGLQVVYEGEPFK